MRGMVPLPCVRVRIPRLGNIVHGHLQSGWRNSPGFWFLFLAAPEHSHVNTFHNAVVTPFGRAATSHVQVSSPAEGESPVSLPPGYRVPPGDGGVATKPFFTRRYVDDAVFGRAAVFHGRRTVCAGVAEPGIRPWSAPR